MNVALWIIAGMLAIVFLAGGAVKLIQPSVKLCASGMGSVEDFSASAVEAIGTLEVLAAMGLILLAALDIAPVLVPLAAAGLVLLMVGAMITHLRHHEARKIAVNPAGRAHPGRLRGVVASTASLSPDDPPRRLAAPGRDTNRRGRGHQADTDHPVGTRA